ncbi:MAG: amidohydrolase [Gammaproteobacteria bacterium]|nr:amidohydrolase [Gammaproteobacteria bacterium]
MNIASLSRSFIALCAVVVLAGCQDSMEAREPADVVFRGGHVHTVTQGVAQAVAATSGTIVFVGSNEDAAAFTGPDTRVVDLDGRFMMPGIVDAHVHPLGGAIKELFQCNFPFSATPEQIVAVLRECVAQRPDAEWIVGGQWDSGLFERFSIESPRKLLDAVSGSAAVFFSDDSGHNGWANSRALDIAGITAETADPAGGSIGRETDSTPNGLLFETAQGLAYEVIPKYSDAQHLQAARWLSDTANSMGITAMKAAAIEEIEIAAFHEADLSDSLNLHIATSIRTPYGHRTTPLDYDEIDRIRDTYASENVDTRFVKIFLDGVPTPARTAAMIHPYLPDEEHGADYTGPLHIDVNTLAPDLIELDRRGYTVKIHTAGDRSVRVALDAIELARDATGNAEKRHELAHAGYIDESDLPRFAALNAVADLSPVIWHPSPIIDAVIMAVGEERGERYWPVRDLLDSGAPVLAGSDWPSAVPDANPWVGIEAFVTRRDPRGDAPGALWPEQAITLAEAIEIYTTHGAKAMLLGDQVGSIVVGRKADLIILERNPFDIPIEEVGDTVVLQTWFDGRLVYEK